MGDRPPAAVRAAKAGTARLGGKNKSGTARLGRKDTATALATNKKGKVAKKTIPKFGRFKGKK